MLVTGIAELLNPQYAATKSQKRRCRSPVGQRLFCFFSGALGQLRIRFLRQPGVETSDKTVKLPCYVSALLSFLPHPCRERACPFRFFRGALGQLRIHISLVARFGTMVETVVAAPYVGAMLSFAAHPNCLPLAELEGKMPLAADEVLLYPRRRRYIIVICIDFAGTKICRS